jgi:hypothetical protein
MFPEALILHYLDDLDSKMEAMRAHFEREAGLDDAWTGYNSSLGRPLLNSAKFLETLAGARAAGVSPDSGREGLAEPAPPQPVSADSDDQD